MTAPRFGFLVHSIARLLRTSFARRAASLQMTEAQWRALSLLAKQEGVTQAALAREMNISSITLGRLIGQLESAHLVTRQVVPNDRRSFHLYLTPSSKATVKRIFKIADDCYEAGMRGIASKDREHLMALMERISENLAADADDRYA